MFVYNAMTKPVPTVRLDAPAIQAYEQMMAEDLEALPVVNRVGDLVGIVTLVDLLKDLIRHTEQGHLSEVTVEHVFRADVQTIHQDEIVEEAALIMRNHDYSALPVVDDYGHLVGIITESDIYNVFIEMMGLRERGTRITMIVPDRMGVLAEITQIIRKAGVSIASLATFLPDDGATANVVVRLKTTEAAAVVDALVEAGYRVTHVSQVWA